jgi:hypothetical protein
VATVDSHRGRPVLIAAAASLAGYTMRGDQRDNTRPDPGTAQVVALLHAPDARLTTRTVAAGTVTVIVSDSRDRGVAILTGRPLTA